MAIHDAARPFVSEQVITDALAEAEAMGAAAPAVAVKDTIKIANDGAVVQTPDRAALVCGANAPVLLPEPVLEGFGSCAGGKSPPGDR